jgi:hypothetical protein
MATTYAVTVQIWCESPQEAVRRTIIPGSTDEAYVADLAEQTEEEIVIKVDQVADDVLPLR